MPGTDFVRRHPAVATADGYLTHVARGVVKQGFLRAAATRALGEGGGAWTDRPARMTWLELLWRCVVHVAAGLALLLHAGAGIPGDILILTSQYSGKLVISFFDDNVGGLTRAHIGLEQRCGLQSRTEKKYDTRSLVRSLPCMHHSLIDNFIDTRSTLLRLR